MDVTFIVLGGASSGDRFTVSLSESGIVIGRDPSCDIVLQDPKVSRRHGKVSLVSNEVILSDLGSSHGTFHMGFRLTQGDSRNISSGEEFKLGDSLFRVEYQTPRKEEKKAETSGSQRKQLPKLERKQLIAIGGVLLLLLAVVFLMDDSGPEFPPQRSKEKISMPDKKMYGFLPEQGGDRSHADKVNFDLPTSDIVIEYDFTGGETTSVQIDGVKIEQLPKTEGSWEPRLLLVRDPLGGKERTLTFDEESIREENGQLVTKARRWGVRNMRYTSLPADESRSMDELLSGAYSYADELGRSNASVFRLSRVLQRTALGLLRELGLEGQPVPIELETPRPTSELVKLKLEGVIAERKKGVNAQEIVRHLKVVVELIGLCEAEIWRKFTVEVRQALTMSKTKDFVGAHDKLLGVQTMIGDEDDYRWKKALELLDDKKIIPPKIRKNPGKFRKYDN